MNELDSLLNEFMNEMKKKYRGNPRKISQMFLAVPPSEAAQDYLALEELMIFLTTDYEDSLTCDKFQN